MFVFITTALLFTQCLILYPYPLNTLTENKEGKSTPSCIFFYMTRTAFTGTTPTMC